MDEKAYYELLKLELIIRSGAKVTEAFKIVLLLQDLAGLGVNWRLTHKMVGSGWTVRLWPCLVWYSVGTVSVVGSGRLLCAVCVTSRKMKRLGTGRLYCLLSVAFL